MKFIQKIIQKHKTWRHNKKNPNNIFPKANHIVKYAFSVAGRDYYQFDDVFNLPYERGLMALAVYEETRMNCDREYLAKHVEVIRELLHANKIDVFKINQLNEILSERLDLSFNPDLLYKLASIVFFDKNENPSLYEPEYCNKKIEYWREHKGVSDFFLQMPVMELIPFLQSADFDLEKYSQVVDQINKTHMESLSLFTSKN